MKYGPDLLTACTRANLLLALKNHQFQWWKEYRVWLRFRRPLLTPRSRVEHFYDDRCTFMDFKTETAFHSHYKAWKSQDIFLNITLIIFVWKQSVIYTPRMTSWANFNFSSLNKRNNNDKSHNYGKNVDIFGHIMTF